MVQLGFRMVPIVPYGLYGPVGSRIFPYGPVLSPMVPYDLSSFGLVNEKM